MPKKSCARQGATRARGFEIGVDIDQMLEGGARYCDKRPIAGKMWKTIMRALAATKAVPRQAVA